MPSKYSYNLPSGSWNLIVFVWRGLKLRNLVNRSRRVERSSADDNGICRGLEDVIEVAAGLSQSELESRR